MSRKSEDLTGQRFGKLIVVERAEDKIEPSGRHRTMWLCKCDCGKTKSIQTNSLKNGLTKSCGCCSFSMVNSKCFDDLTGKCFGRLKVIQKSDYYISPHGHKEIQWKCKCKCGNTCYVNTYCLKSGITTSCGCYQREQTSKSNTIDLTGKKFGRLTVIEKSKTTKRGVLWKCLCDCGNVCEVIGTNLSSGNTKSCGCYNKDKIFEAHFKDLTGLHFGKLIVLKRDKDYIQPDGKHKIMWLCKCECGNTVSVISHSLISGKTISCGCIKSTGEYNINTYLSRNNINYQSQKKFNGLVGLGGNPLSYDFYLPDYNILIEAQGKQHESSIEIFGGDEQFLRQQEHDRRKREYAETNGYRLLEIWYYDYDNINEILDKALLTKI